MQNCAAPSLFGWDFQVNAAIAILIDNIKDVDKVRLEGSKQDIEITLSNKEKIYAQAKSVEKAGDYSNVKKHLTNALNSLNNTAHDEDGIIKKGVVVRHLILPSNTKNSIAALNSLHNHFGSRLTVSLMAQYIPCGIAEQYPEINRKITRREYQKVFNCLTELDFDGFAQELNSAKSTYIPDFNLQGLE